MGAIGCRGGPGFFLPSATDPTVPLWLCCCAPHDLLPRRLLQPKVVEFLLQKFGRPRGPADVWVDITDVNVFMQEWTAEHFHVVQREADKMLSGRWHLPQRRRHVPAAALAADAPDVESVVPVRRGTTLAYRYLHRAVSHFYQRVGNKAVSAFSTFVNDHAGLGTLRRTRGTRTKVEVVFAPDEAADLLVGDAFITDLVNRAGVVRALHVVFSVLGVLHLFSEAGAAPGSADVIACLTAHFALVSMKIRACLKKRAASESDDEDAIDTTPGLNGGHRAEWVEELATVRHLLASQDGRTCNGLRLTDGEQPRRDDPSYREPSAPTAAAGSAPPVPTAPPIINDVMQAAGAVMNGSVDGPGNGEEPLDAEAAGPMEQEAVAAAHAAVAYAMAGTYEEVD